MSKIAADVKQQIQERIKTINESVHTKITHEFNSNMTHYSTFKAPSISKQKK